jgi:membrane protease YdiL (CAAX protease family)/ribosomal protein S18 acetylase RimI-like enzyme
MRYQLKQCIEIDREWAYALKSEAYREVVERQFGPWDEKLQRDLFAARWNPTISQIVMIDGLAVGLVATEDRSDELWLDEIQVARDWRGQGLGSAVVGDLIDRARKDCKPLRLQVLKENTRAQNLYRRLGFRATGKTATHVLMESGDASISTNAKTSFNARKTYKDDSASTALNGITPRQRWTELGLVTLIAIVPFTLSAIFMPANSGMPTIGMNYGLAAGLLHEVGGLSLLLYFLGRRGQSLKNLGFGWRWTDLPVGLGLAFLSLVLTAITSCFFYYYCGLVPGHTPYLRDPRTIFAGGFPPLMITYMLSSCFFEETIVRGYVTTELIGLTCPAWLATLASILLQTSYHLYYGFAGAIIASGAFVVFALYFVRYRRLTPIILGHLFVNLAAYGRVLLHF